MILLAFILLGASDDGWQVARRTERTIVERRPRTDGLMETRASSITDVPAEAIANQFWFPRTQIAAVKKRIVFKHDDKEMIVYHQMRVPVAKDRDYTVRLTRYADPANGLYQFTSDCASELGPPENTEHVRIKNCHSITTIERQADGTTNVSYVAFADPAGRLPRWIVNMLAPKASADLLEKLIDEAREALAKP